MRKPISTKAHGFLDYMTAGLLFALPRALGWGKTPTRVLDVAAAGAAAYSLLTRYELGVCKVLPMKAHLALDAMSGAALIGAAAVLEDEDPEVRGTLAALGAFEIGASLLTRTEPDVNRGAADNLAAAKMKDPDLMPHMNLSGPSTGEDGPEVGRTPETAGNTPEAARI